MNHTRLTSVAVAAALGAAACSTSGTPGVLVNPLATDIVFGLADEPDPTPTNFPTTAPAPTSVGSPPPPTTPPRIPEFRSNGPSVFLGGPASECPPAALTEFPDETASVTVEGMPREGVYEFRHVLSTRVGEDAPAKEVEAFQEHEIQNVERVSDIEFEFDLVQPDATAEVAGRRVVQHFVVNTNPELLVNESEGGQTIGVVDIPGADVQVPEPGNEAGIFLTRIEVFQDEESLSVFEPVLPAKYLALDEGIVTPGDTWETISLDPSTGDVMIHSGTVTRKNRIDACGDIVEGWEIEAEQTFNGAVRQYRYTFATQYGAMLIGETINYTEGDVNVQAVLNIAEQAPLLDPGAEGADDEGVDP